MPDPKTALQIDPTDAGWKLTGDIDAATAPQLAAVLEGAAGPNVVLDVENVTFIDSSGLRVLIDLAGRIGSESIILQHPSRAVTRLLDLTGLGSMFIIQTTSTHLGD